MTKRGGLGLGLSFCLSSVLSLGCRGDRTALTGATTGPGPAGPPVESTVDAELEACRAHIAAVERAPELPGDPSFEENRVAILGRARGEPMLMMRAPKATPDSEFSPAIATAIHALDRAPAAGRVATLRAHFRSDPETLRKLVLREGYAYTTDALDAYGLVTHVTLADLFKEPTIWIQRGIDTRKLERAEKRHEITYRYTDGPLAGRAADLLFGDRVALDEAGLDKPLHRDLKRLADREGFDRTRIARRTEDAIIADVRYGTTWVKALMTSKGAELQLSCLAEEKPVREAIAAYRAESGPKRRALLAMHETVTEEVHEAFRFDRPEGVTGPDRDGELRPVWLTAYLQGRSSFQNDGTTYSVFDSEGKAWPPEVCVDFVLDTFERTSGTWFKPRGAELGRMRGRLDFNDENMANRRGVIAFGQFAESKPDLFDVWRVPEDKRVPLRDRGAFFGFFSVHEDEVKAGDVVAIQGMKADHRIHQHAILVEWTDPVTGFPFGLADQMKRPRRRTWEGIMAEAPARSLFYRIRPKPVVFEKLDPGE